MAGTMSVGGLMSGLDTNGIITKVMDLAKRPQTQLKNEKVADQTKLAAWQDLNTRVLAVKMKADALATQKSINKYSVTTSDQTKLTATATSDAAPGAYFIKVMNRAQGHQVAGQAKGVPNPTPFTSTTADIGTGRLSFQVGSDTSLDRDTSKDFFVDINSANNTLQGARDAINKANKGVQATIVNTGTTSSPSYQLLLTSTATGDQSQFTVNAGDTSLDFSTVTQKGIDANIQLGDGENSTAIDIHKATNTIDDLIPGVSLNIVDVDKTKTIKVDVSRNTAAVKTAIQDFVTQFNDLNKAVNDQFVVDPTTGNAGALMGDWDLQDLQQSLMSVVTNTVPGAEKNYSSLAAVGVTLNMTGDLQIDDATLSNAIETAPDKVVSLFAAGMQSDSTYVSYLASGSNTQASGTDGWSVDVTQPATKAQVTGAKAIPLDGLGSSEILTVSAIGGKSRAISLSLGMKLSQIVGEVNTYSAETGVAAVATDADGNVSSDSAQNLYLTLRSARYGLAYDVSAFSSRSNGEGFDDSTGIGTKPVTGTDPKGELGNQKGFLGSDVQGTINGEYAYGLGQVLTSDPETNKLASKGLALLIASDAPMTTRVVFTKGVGTMIRDTLTNMTSTTGTVTKAENGLNDRMLELDKQIADWDTRLQTQQDRISAQFSAMESQLAKLQDQGNYLSQQISSMNKG